MLIELNIRNFAIISSSSISFSKGFTALTGETGAGKSIIVDAVSLLMGGRASSDIIRSGADSASVEAVFDLSSNESLIKELEEMGIENPSEILVKRIISSEGKNRQLINGSPVTLSMLSSVTSRLINIYGQHESQSLLKSDNHLDLLDSFAKLQSERGAFSSIFNEWRSAVSEIEKIRSNNIDKAKRLDLLEYQFKEITDASLALGEDDNLEQQREMLQHANLLADASYSGYDRLYASDDSLLGELDKVIARLSDAMRHDQSLSHAVENLKSLYAGIEDAALYLRSYSEKIENDPTTLSAVEERLDLIQRLKRKYGGSIEEVLAYKAQISREIDDLNSVEDTLQALEKRVLELNSDMESAGRALSEKRRAKGEEFSSMLSRELADLSMPDASVTVSFTNQQQPTVKGYESAEFLISSNRGEPPRSLSRVASGGELSRLMLAIKQILPESDVPTLIFDEVDAGIGGITAANVGRKLKKVSKGQQVFCITHLAQLASCADTHIRVEKQLHEGRTVSRTDELTPEERVTEISRMLGGVEGSEASIAHARELLSKRGEYNA